MGKLLLSVIMLVSTFNTMAATESTSFGRITGIETRDWGLHVQTTFGAGAANGCSVSVGDGYMYDFRHDNVNNGTESSDEVSILLAAFAAQSNVAFHIYGCNSAVSRPLIGFIRLKK